MRTEQGFPPRDGNKFVVFRHSNEGKRNSKSLFDSVSQKSLLIWFELLQTEIIIRWFFFSFKSLLT